MAKDESGDFAELTCEVRGVSALLMHNGQLADPLNPVVQAMKPLTAKRKKTEDDHLEIARMEFLGGMYLGADGLPCIPGENIESMIAAAARKTKRGKDVAAGLFVDDSPTLLYSGPKDPAKLFDDKRFVDRRGVVVSQARVFRTRPRFKDWGLTFTVTYDVTVFDRAVLIDIIETGGKYIGLGDFRPKFGRFKLVKHS